LDHRFQGTAVLPAAEAIQLLARTAAMHHPEFSVDDIREIRLLKFLAISPDAPRLDAIAQIEPLSDGRVWATLITRTTARASGIVRVKVHVSLIFGPTPPPADQPPSNAPSRHGMTRPDDPLTLTGRPIYESLVPFGPAFQTVQTLRLDPAGAVADLVAPKVETFPGPLGSPFVVDGAFHAACVWGQRFAGIVAFPVAIDRRRVIRPTVPGQRYLAEVTPVGEDAGVLSFEMEIRDADGRLCERVTGLRMRDVSGGRWRPVDWIRG
jgi:hypothetical protein